MLADPHRRPARRGGRAIAAIAARAVDEDGAARRLAGGPALSHHLARGPAAFDAAPFEALHAYLARSYPRLHAALARELVGGASLLYTWKGREPELPALLLLAHQDVVPVESGTEAHWAHPPFEGVIDGGFVWGRGAIDDKGSICRHPRGDRGAARRGLRARAHAAARASATTRRWAASRARGDRRAAREPRRRDRVGARRGRGDRAGRGAGRRDAARDGRHRREGLGRRSMLSIEIEGGHSSTPPRHTAIGILAAALTRLEASPMPGRDRGPDAARWPSTSRPELALPFRVVLANLWLFGPLLERAMSRAAGARRDAAHHHRRHDRGRRRQGERAAGAGPRGRELPDPAGRHDRRRGGARAADGRRRADPDRARRAQHAAQPDRRKLRSTTRASRAWRRRWARSSRACPRFPSWCWAGPTRVTTRS